METTIPVAAIGRTPPRPQAGPQDPPCPSRRGLLKAGAVLGGLLAAGTPLALLAPGRAWALPLKTLEQGQADHVLALARTLYPHKGLPDAVYALVAKDIDAQAAAPAVQQEIASGIAALDRAAGGAWLAQDAAGRAAAVRKAEQDPYVRRVRAQCITSLYDNDMAYAHFGYEGASYDKGGYLFRGFSDLQWLPEPPAQASPPFNP